MAHKGVYLAGGDLIVCRNVPGFLLYAPENILASMKNIQAPMENNQQNLD
jgi:hypothetical protein